jgi:two-component system, cell cycle sensor histidine kinase and response regulator CckA
LPRRHRNTEDHRLSGTELLAELAASLAAASRFDQIVDVVREGVERIGFGGMWLAVLEEQTGRLTTIKQVIDGVDTTRDMPRLSALDPRLPIGRAFHERRFINFTDPSQVIPLDSDDDAIRPGKVALPRVSYDQLRGRPFASGPLLGSRGQPVGALGLTSYHGLRMAAIPDELLSSDLVRGFTHHLGLALERALHVAQLDERLARANAALADDAQLKTIGQLAGSVAHDLNNLSLIALLATSIGARSPADAFEMMPGIEKAAVTMRDLLARLQRLARPPAGERADLQQVVDDILAMTQPLVRERSIDFTVDIPLVPLVRCDAVLLHRVVLNLLLNACEAVAELAPERRRVQIRAHHDADVVRVVVADSGPGIAPEILPKLFQAFHTSRPGSHQGLGLAGSRAALEPFGARLEGRNDPAGGAVFEIVLEDAGAGLPERRPAPPAPVASRPAPNLRILAVDDEPDLVGFIQLYLEPLGYQVATATDADKALEAARTGAFDIVLCDFGMPRHNGLELCRLLRESGYRGKLVLMTGWETQSLTSEQLTAHCDALLKKPFKGAELVQAIDGLVEPSPSGRAPAQQ